MADMKVVGVKLEAQNGVQYVRIIDSAADKTNDFLKELVKLQKAQNKANEAHREASKRLREQQEATKKSSKALNDLISKSLKVKLTIAGVSAALGTMSFKFAKSVINASKELDKFQTQFTVLLKSEAEAQRRLAELSKFAATTPFQLEEVAKASRVLQNFTGNILSTGQGLRMVGDAAASVGYGFADLALWVGRAYDGLQSNRPIGEAMMRLQELALVSGNARNQIELLQKSGRGKEAWTVLENELKKNAGGMEMLSKTGAGLESTFRDLYKEVLRQIGRGGAYELYKNSLSNINKELTSMIEDKVFFKFGDGLNKALPHVKNMLKWTSPLYIAFKQMKLTLDLFSKDKDKLFPWEEMDKAAERLSKGIDVDWEMKKSLMEQTSKTFKMPEVDTRTSDQKKRDERLKLEAKKINEEFQLIGLQGREKELKSLEQHFQKRMELVRGNKEAEKQLTQIWNEEKAQINKEYDQKDYEFQQIKFDSHVELWRKQQEELAEQIKIKREEALALEDRIMQESISKMIVEKDTEIAFVTEKYNERKKLLEKFNIDTENLTLLHTKNVEEIEKRHADTKKQIQMSQLSATSEMFKGISALIKASSKESKKAAILQKTLSIFSITADTAVAIMKAFRESNYYVATAKAVAIGAMGAAQIATVAATPNYKDGKKGDIPMAQSGLSGGSQVGDRNTVRINGDEQITNRRQQANQMMAYGISGGVTAANQRKLFDLIDSGAEPRTNNNNYTFNISFNGSPSSITQSEKNRAKQIVLELIQDGQMEDVLK